MLGQKYKYILLNIFLTGSLSILGQEAQLKSNANLESFRILFYNTENFFDYFDDPNTNDNDFLPLSKYHWTKEKYETKLNNIYKVIISTNIETPSIIGFSEIENKKVLYDLIQKTPLIKYPYSIIHQDSPDPRGIDVALLYQRDKYKPLENEFIKIIFPFDIERKTRDILYSKGVAYTNDTLHIFVNHWPSRRGGEANSLESRNFVAKTLRLKVDSILNVSSKAKIIIMGDFNDEPDNESITTYLNTKQLKGLKVEKQLYNLSYAWLNNISSIGTHKFQGKWTILDQFIVSSELIGSKKGLSCNQNSASILKNNFLLIDDKSNYGYQPNRNYNGYHYNNGFSDHLPIYLVLNNK